MYNPERATLVQAVLGRWQHIRSRTLLTHTGACRTGAASRSYAYDMPVTIACRAYWVPSMQQLGSQVGVCAHVCSIAALLLWHPTVQGLTLLARQYDRRFPREAYAAHSSVAWRTTARRLAVA